MVNVYPDGGIRISRHGHLCEEKAPRAQSVMHSGMNMCLGDGTAKGWPCILCAFWFTALLKASSLCCTRTQGPVSGGPCRVLGLWKGALMIPGACSYNIAYPCRSWLLHITRFVTHHSYSSVQAGPRQLRRKKSTAQRQRILNHKHHFSRFWPRAALLLH